MSEELMLSLRSGGPVSPVVQMRKLLSYGRERGWEFEVAWKWSFERIRWCHDTTHRLQWKEVLGASYDDPSKLPVAQREMWRRAYDRSEPTANDASVGRLMLAA